MFFLDLNPGVDLAFVFADAQRHFDLFGGILITQLDVFGQLAHVGRRAFLQVRQAGANIPVVEIFVAGDGDLADHALADLQPHDTGGEFLLRHIDIHGPVTEAAILSFQGFQGLLHIAIELALAYKGGNQLLSPFVRQNRIPFDLETYYVETRVLRYRVIQRSCRQHDDGCQQLGYRFCHKQILNKLIDISINNQGCF